MARNYHRDKARGYRVRGSVIKFYEQHYRGDGPHRCELCGRSQLRNGLYTHLTYDHVDHNPNNNDPKNIREICLDCNAMLATTCRRKGSLPPLPLTVEFVNQAKILIRQGYSYTHLAELWNSSPGQVEWWVVVRVHLLNLYRKYRQRRREENKRLWSILKGTP